MSTSFLDSSSGRRLAYRYTPPRSGRTYVWLPGFKSDMQGSKVCTLEDWAVRAGHGFLAFDYSGHGESEGAFKDGTISKWRADTLDLITTLTEGPIILVGSSMGAWIALLCADALADRIQSMILIAPAPDFTEKLMWAEFSDEAKSEVETQGYTLRPSDYDEPYMITKELIEDGKKWSILDGPIPFDGPVRIIQGMLDEDVPWQHAFRLVETITSHDVLILLVKDGDHRLSRDEDLGRMIRICERI